MAPFRLTYIDGEAVPDDVRSELAAAPVPTVLVAAASFAVAASLGVVFSAVVCGVALPMALPMAVPVMRWWRAARNEARTMGLARIGSICSGSGERPLGLGGMRIPVDCEGGSAAAHLARTPPDPGLGTGGHES